MDLSLADDLFRLHFDRLPGAAFIWRRDGDDFRIVALNEAAAVFGDREASSLIGWSATQMGALDPEFPVFLNQAAAGGEIITQESDRRMQSGITRRVIDTYVPLSPDMVVVHSRDVTGERETEGRLRASEARFRALVEAMPDTLLRMDAEARILDVHFPKSMESPPWDPEELIGRTVGDFYGPRAQTQQAHYNREAIRTGETQLFEVRMPTQQGDMFLESRVVRVGENEVVVTVRDVSEHAELEERQVISEQRELNRLSREIHDGLAQVLVGASLRLSTVRKSLEQNGSELVQALDSVGELIGEAVSQARDLSKGLSPVPQNTPLFDALNIAARYAEQGLGIRCEFSHRGKDDAVGEFAVTHLYRIAQEAMTNAVRHGRATRVALNCDVAADWLVLSIEDDGSGLSDNLDSGGIGIRNMRYRARKIGGQIRLENAGNGRGARLECSCQLPQQPAAVAT